MTNNTSTSVTNFQESMYDARCIDQELLESVETVIQRIESGVYKVKKTDSSPCIGKIFTNNQHGTVINGYCDKCWGKMPIPLGFVHKKYYTIDNGQKVKVNNLHCIIRELTMEKNKILMPVFGTSSDYNLIKCMLENTFKNNRGMVQAYLDFLTVKTIDKAIWRSTVVEYLRYIATLLDKNAEYFVFHENTGGTLSVNKISLKNFALIDIPLLKSLTYSNNQSLNDAGVIFPGTVYLKTVMIKDIIENSRLEKNDYTASIKNNMQVAFFCISETKVEPMKLTETVNKYGIEVRTEDENAILIANKSTTIGDQHAVSDSLQAESVYTDLRLVGKQNKNTCDIVF